MLSVLLKGRKYVGVVRALGEGCKDALIICMPVIGWEVASSGILSREKCGKAKFRSSIQESDVEMGAGRLKVFRRTD